MSGKVVKGIGITIILLGVIIGIAAGAILHTPASVLGQESGFNVGLMITFWLSGALTGLLFLALGTILDRLEAVEYYLSSSAEASLGVDKDDHANEWQCAECGTYNSKYSVACKNCGKSS